MHSRNEHVTRQLRRQVVRQTAHWKAFPGVPGLPDEMEVDYLSSMDDGLLL